MKLYFTYNLIVAHFVKINLLIHKYITYCTYVHSEEKSDLQTKFSYASYSVLVKFCSGYDRVGGRGF